MKGHRISYSPAELAWLEENRSLPIGDYHRAFSETFARYDVSAGNLHALRKRRGWKTGRTGQFAGGQVPHNKGKAMPYHPNSAATRFQKGERRGVAVRLYKPIGTERLSKDGYVQRKVNDDLPLQARWRFVHLIRWEEANGPLPKGFALKCLDGDRGNTAPDNWAAVPRGMLPRLNGRFGRGYDAAPAELKPTILAVTRLEHATRQHRAPRRRSEAA